MHTSVHSDYLHCSRTTSLTSRTAVYGPVRTVVWQGSAGDCRPYADHVGLYLRICSPPERKKRLLGHMVATSSLDIDIDVSKSASSPHQLFQARQFWKRALGC